jgi:magnesium-transporting ATPase (P-type)
MKTEERPLHVAQEEPAHEDAELKVINSTVEGDCRVARVLCLYESLPKNLAFVVVSFLSLGLVWLVSRWSVAIKRKLCYRYCSPQEATHFKVLNWDGSWSIHPRQYLWRGEMFVNSFFNRYLCYVVGSDKTVRPVTYEPANDIACRTGLPHPEVQSRRQVYGRNEMKVEKPSKIALFLDQILNPFYFVEVFCISIWLAEGYYSYACIILLAFVVSTLYDIYLIELNIDALEEKAVAAADLKVWVVRQREKKRISATQLVPGDLFLLECGEVPCDCILIEGQAVVD